MPATTCRRSPRTASIWPPSNCAALGTPWAGELKADQLELDGRQALLRGDASAAKAALLAAADLRRAALDYAGMARVLALAGAAAGSGPDAADLYLRAGRSAA